MKVLYSSIDAHTMLWDFPVVNEGEAFFDVEMVSGVLQRSAEEN